MAYRPRTDKPKYLRPNSFKGNAFEIVGTTSGSGLRDINGETPPHNILNTTANIGISRCSNSEAMQASLLRENFAYYTATKPVAATYESGTMWIAFKLLAKSGGWHEWMSSIDAARQFFVSSGYDNVQFKVNGSYNIAPAGGGFGAIGSLNVIGYSWGSDGYKGYINGNLVVSDSTLPTGIGRLTGLSIGTWTGGTPYMDRADYYSIRVLPRALSDAEHKAWADDIWHPYRVVNTRKIFIPNSAIPGLAFTVANNTSNTVMDNINVTQNQTLPIANALSNSIIDTLTLLQAQGLTLANLVSTPSLGTAALTQQHMLSIFNAQSNSEASALTLSQQQQLNILNLDAASFVDAVIVTSDGTQILVVANMTAASELQAAGLTQQHIFNITDVIAHSFAQDLSVIQNDGTVTFIALDTYSQTYLNNVLLSQSQVININSFVSNSFAESLIVALATLGAIQLPGVTALTPKRDLNSLTPVREVRTIH